MTSGPKDGLGFVVLLALVVISIIWTAIYEHAQTQKCGYLCTDGFLIMTASGQVLTAVRWEEIQEVHRSTSQEDDSTIHKWQILTRENTPVTISHGYYMTIREMENLGEQVFQAFRHLHPEYQTRQQRGTTNYYVPER